MSQARYDAYKDSGIEWLGDVPSEWRVAKVKSTCSHLRDGTHGSFERVNDGYPLLSVRNIVNSKFVLLSDDSCISEHDYKSISKSLKIKEGDLQLAIVGATLGKVALVPENMPQFVTQRSLATLRPIAKILYNRFLFYFAGNSYFQDTLWSKANYSAQPGIYLYTISNIDFLLPPVAEQTAIVNYLDTKTAQLDRKIDLLGQKAAQYGKLKQSLINETVTRGLDKTVVMKDSGVEWIGEVPAHWEVKRVKELGHLVLGKMLDNVKSENTFYRSYLKSKNIGWLKVEDSNIEQMYFSLAEMKAYRLKKDDILLSEGGEVGKTSFWNDEIEECYIQNSVHKITMYKNNSPRFFLYQSFLLGSIKYYDSIVSHVSIKHLTKEKLSRVNWVRPPLAEQQAIATYLDSKTAHIDRIVATLNTQIDSLKELRKTLINDIVTGKICIFKQEASHE